MLLQPHHVCEIEGYYFPNAPDGAPDCIQLDVSSLISDWRELYAEYNRLSGAHCHAFHPKGVGYTDPLPCSKEVAQAFRTWEVEVERLTNELSRLQD